MTVTFSMQIKLVFTDLPWVYIFPPAGLHWLMMSLRWDQPFSTLMLVLPSHWAGSGLPGIRHYPATQCFPLCHSTALPSIYRCRKCVCCFCHSCHAVLAARWSCSALEDEMLLRKLNIVSHDVDSRLQAKIPQCYNRYQWLPSVVVLLGLLQLVSKNVLKV